MNVIKLLIITITFVILGSVSVFAVQVFVNGNIIGVKGELFDGITMVPLRGVFEELGYTVGYDTLTQTAYINSDDTNIVIKNGKYNFTVNDKVIYPPAAQRIIKGVFYIPLRSVAESINADVKWDNGIVFITTPNVEIVENDVIDEGNAIFQKYSGIDLDYYVNDNVADESSKTYIYKEDEKYYFAAYSDGNLSITELDKNMTVIDKIDIPCELPIFGGYLHDGKYHYILTGDTAENIYDETPVYNIKQYDETFTLFHERTFSARTTGIKTPFLDGCADIEADGKYIYIMDSCERFTTDHPEKIQANYAFCLNKNNFTLANKGIINEISFADGKVRKDFKAFVCRNGAEDGEFRVCFLNEAPPQSVVTKKSSVYSFNPSFYQKIHTVYNSTDQNAVKLRGLEKMRGSSIAVGISMPIYDNRSVNNVFVSVIPDSNNTDTLQKTVFLTNNSDISGIQIGRVSSVKINDDSLLVLWEEIKDGTILTSGAAIDSEGKIIQRLIEDKYMKLSQCELFVDENYVMWFCSYGDTKKTYLYKLQIQ